MFQYGDLAFGLELSDARYTQFYFLDIPKSSVILFTNPSAQAGYDTRSIFKRSLTGLNSEFSFS